MSKLQKYPDLETCKAISHLFEDSESAYYEGAYDEPVVLKKDPSIVWEKFCNAPDCANLGGMVRKVHFIPTRKKKLYTY